jgi:ClpP class serine protease
MIPMNRKMKKNFASSVDRHYSEFKRVVSNGRGLPLETVEHIAQGKVWTGEQAKNIGLVDEIGGLARAIAYARRNYTASGEEALVESWPKTSLSDLLLEKLNEDPMKLFSGLYGLYYGSQAGQTTDEPDFGRDVVDYLLKRAPSGLSGTLSGFFLTANEDTAIRCLFEDLGYKREQPKPIPALPFFFWK